MALESVHSGGPFEPRRFPPSVEKNREAAVRALLRERIPSCGCVVGEENPANGNCARKRTSSPLDLMDQERKRARIDGQIARLEKSLKVKDERLERLSARLLDKTTVVKDLKEALKGLRGETRSLKEQCNALGIIRDRDRKHLSELEEQCLTLQSEYETLLRRHESSAERNLQLARELGQTLEAVNELTQQNKQFKDQVEHLIQDLEFACSEIHYLEQHHLSSRPGPKTNPQHADNLDDSCSTKGEDRCHETEADERHRLDQVLCQFICQSIGPLGKKTQWRDDALEKVLIDLSVAKDQLRGIVANGEDQDAKNVAVIGLMLIRTIDSLNSERRCNRELKTELSEEGRRIDTLLRNEKQLQRTVSKLRQQVAEQACGSENSD